VFALIRFQPPVLSGFAGSIANLLFTLYIATYCQER
jgi:hypothetical protein